MRRAVAAKAHPSKARAREDRHVDRFRPDVERFAELAFFLDDGDPFGFPTDDFVRAAVAAASREEPGPDGLRGQVVPAVARGDLALACREILREDPDVLFDDLDDAGRAAVLAAREAAEDCLEREFSLDAPFWDFLVEAALHEALMSGELLAEIVRQGLSASKVESLTPRFAEALEDAVSDQEVTRDQLRSPGDLADAFARMTCGPRRAELTPLPFERALHLFRVSSYVRSLRARIVAQGLTPKLLLELQEGCEQAFRLDLGESPEVIDAWRARGLAELQDLDLYHDEEALEHLAVALSFRVFEVHENPLLRMIHLATLDDAFEFVEEELEPDVEAVLEAPEDQEAVQRLVHELHVSGERSRRHTVEAYLATLRGGPSPGAAAPAPQREGAVPAAGAVSLTRRQAEYLAFIRDFTRLNDKAPSEAEIARYFKITAPSVHTMILKLEKIGAISRRPRVARSIRVLVPSGELPRLNRLPPVVTAAPRVPDVGGTAVKTACRVVTEMLAETERVLIDDRDLVPLLEAVARATEGTLLASGANEDQAREARTAVLRFAAASYTRLCAVHDSDGADPEEDSERFRSLLRERRREPDSSAMGDHERRRRHTDRTNTRRGGLAHGRAP